MGECDPRHNTGQQEAQSRRGFLKRTGERVLWAAPAVSVMMLASGTQAQANGGYNKNEHNKAYDKHKKAKKNTWKSPKKGPS